MTTLTLFALEPPNVTVSLAWNFSPVIVTLVPPAVRPEVGVKLVGLGAVE